MIKFKPYGLFLINWGLIFWSFLGQNLSTKYLLYLEFPIIYLAKWQTKTFSDEVKSYWFHFSIIYHPGQQVTGRHHRRPEFQRRCREGSSSATTWSGRGCCDCCDQVHHRVVHHHIRHCPFLKKCYFPHIFIFYQNEKTMLSVFIKRYFFLLFSTN